MIWRILLIFSVRIQEEVFRKSSRAACSCCHCQKQSELPGLHSGSRRSRGAGEIFRPIFCLLDRVSNKLMTADPAAICQRTRSKPPSIRQRYLDIQSRMRKMYARMHRHVNVHAHGRSTQTHKSLESGSGFVWELRGPFRLKVRPDKQRRTVGWKICRMCPV